MEMLSPLILNLYTRYRGVVSFTPHLFYPQYPLETGWVDSRCCTMGYNMMAKRFASSLSVIECQSSKKGHSLYSSRWIIKQANMTTVWTSFIKLVRVGNQLSWQIIPI